MKKTFVVVLVSLLTIFTVFGISSEAKVAKFEYFSIDVPDGWKVVEDKENYTTSFLAPGDSAALTVSFFESEGASLEEISGVLLNALNGKNLTKTGGAYTFEFENENGVACTGIAGGDEMIMFLTIIGQHDDMEKMIDSLQ